MDFGFGFWDLNPPTFATAAAASAPTFAATVKKPPPKAAQSEVEEMRSKLSKVRIGTPAAKAVRTV